MLLAVTFSKASNYQNENESQTGNKFATYETMLHLVLPEFVRLLSDHLHH